MRFEETYLSDEALDALDAMGFSECTPVQEQAIPMILDGEDLLAVAQTGTGKTAAYLLPIMDEILARNCGRDTVNCLVMVPTRELAMQVDQQLQGFAYYMPISSIAVYGGTDGKVFSQQHTALTQGADIVIATPGRLIAHLAMGDVSLEKTQFLVLDEADRMLDMGFCDDILNIVGRMGKERQTLMFSATMPKAIEKLAEDLLTNPKKISLSIAKPPERIHQMACRCQEGDKEGILLHFLKNPELGRTIVFASSKLKVKEMGRSLRKAGIKIAEMHSDLDQVQRDETMRAFKSGRVMALMATDLVARGIDIDDIELVVNYDVPHDCEDYVHRVGRTARAQKDGTSLTLVGPRDRMAWRKIEQFLGDSKVTVNNAADFLGDKACKDSSRPSGKERGPRKPRKPRRKAETASASKPKQASDQPTAKPQKRHSHHRKPKPDGGANLQAQDSGNKD